MKRSQKKDTPEFVYQYLEKNPDATFTDYKHDYPNTKLKSSIFGSRKYMFRNNLKGRDRKGKASSLSELSAINQAIKNLVYEDSNTFIHEYLSIDPNRSLVNLKIDFPQCRMKSGTFYSRKHHFKNGTLQQSNARTYAKRKNNFLYMTIWRFDLDGKTPIEKKIAKEIINDLINSVSETTRINWQVVELVEPPSLELREIAK